MLHAGGQRPTTNGYRPGQVSDAARKIRNTLRYILGNLNDYDPASHAVKYDKLPDLDKYMLGRLSEVRPHAVACGCPSRAWGMRVAGYMC
jgi:isoleucyl-tRNA synthetase